MARRQEGERVLGPYPNGRKWRVIYVGPGGERSDRFFATRDEAQGAVKAIRKQLNTTSISIEEAMGQYERFLRDEKGNKPGSVRTTMHRLGQLFAERNLPLGSLSGPTCAGYYDALRTRVTKLGKPVSVDVHRNTLAESKTFLRWCMKRKWLTRNPLEQVEGIGKRKHGKPQLRIDEARRWMATAVKLAGEGETGAVGAMMSLVMGMRAGEIVSRVVRDVDDGGRVLWIPDSKTEAGKRTLEVPAVLRPHLLALAKGKDARALLFGQHWRDWVRKAVARICREARVPEVSAHGMRGLHATLAMDAGVTGHVVAASLGHESETTTKRSYAKQEAVVGARQRKAVGILGDAGARGGGASEIEGNRS
jgi:site-specific recombinase XerD